MACGQYRAAPVGSRAPYAGHRRPPAPVVGQHPGRARPVRAVRRAHAHRPERPGRVQADAGRADRRDDARRRARGRVPDARARRLPGAERRGDRGRAGVRRAAGLLLPARPARSRRPRRRGAAWTRARSASSCTRAPSSSRWHEPGVREIVAVAHERRVPVLIHAGRGIPALGAEHGRALEPSSRTRRLILAHAAISDLAWLWHVLPDHPNVFIDTAWWNPADHIALFSLVAPSQIVWASDSPYGLPILAAWTPRALRRCRRASATRRCARSWAARSRGWSRARTRCGSGDAPGALRGRAAPAAGPRRHAPDLGDRPRLRRRRPGRVARAGAAVVRGRRGRAARRRLRRRARAARPLPRAPRAAAARAARSRSRRAS